VTLGKLLRGGRAEKTGGRRSRGQERGDRERRRPPPARALLSRARAGGESLLGHVPRDAAAGRPPGAAGGARAARRGVRRRCVRRRARLARGARRSGRVARARRRRRRPEPAFLTPRLRAAVAKNANSAAERAALLARPAGRDGGLGGLGNAGRGAAETAQREAAFLRASGSGVRR